MLVLRGVSTPAPGPTVLTIGNFDGVHLGHRTLLHRLTEKAEALGLPGAVLTFEPHPREFFAPESAPARLTTLREKLELLGGYGVQLTCVCRFNRRFAALSAEEFVTRVLVQGLHVRHLIIGDDFRFGAGREGDFAFLVAAGRRHGFTVEAMDTVLMEGERASSSGIREALAAGALEQAAKLLGRPYGIDGRVVHGDKIGRQLGFPTANIRVRHNPMPLTGVFAVRVTGAGELPVEGVANMGVRPTLGTPRPLLEVNLFDFQGDLYGAHLSVAFLHKLRDEMKFSGLEALKAQIGRDVQAARAFFGR